MAININAKTTGVGGLETSADNSGNINIQSGGTTVMSVTSSGVAVTGSFSQNGAVYSTQPTFRNLIINGNMQIAQRGTSFTGLSNNTYNIYTIDRWYSEETQTSTFVADITQDTDAPNGYKSSFKVNVTTPQASLISNQQILLEQRIEAYNVSHLAYGSVDAKSLTLSFWVKSSLTGTYIVWFYNIQNGRMISRQYTINSANTWEQKTMTIPGDTGGSSIADNNSAGLYVRFILGAGSDYTGSPLQSSWTAIANSGRYTNQTNLMGTSGATWQITGVQLEVGSTATDFENLPYDVQLARCQRYYEKSYNIGTVAGTLTDNVVGGSGEAVSTTSIESAVYYKVPKRISGNTVTIYAYDGTSGTVSAYDSAGNSGATPAFANKIGEFGYMGVKKSGGTNFTAGAYYWWQWTSSAEL